MNLSGFPSSLVCYRFYAFSSTAFFIIDKLCRDFLSVCVSSVSQLELFPRLTADRHQKRLIYELTLMLS